MLRRLRPLSSIAAAARALEASRRPPRLLLARACASSPSPPPPPPPEVPSVSEEEHKASSLGGAGNLARGELGVSVKDMRMFWDDLGCSKELVDVLAPRADPEGGVWADPQTLLRRLSELLQILTSTSIYKLLWRYPDALQNRPETIRRKLKAVSKAMPETDVLKLFGQDLYLLRYSEGWLVRRAEAFRSLLPRTDMDQVLAMRPGLMQNAEAEMAARSRAILASYSAMSILGWERERVVDMLSTPSARLRRLEHIETLNPRLRITLSDMSVLRMSQSAFDHRFTGKGGRKWRRRPGSTLHGPRPRRLPSLIVEAPPESGVNLLRWGRQQRLAAEAEREARLEQQLQERHEQELRTIEELRGRRVSQYAALREGGGAKGEVRSLAGRRQARIDERDLQRSGEPSRRR